MKKLLAIVLLSAPAFASIGKVATFPIRHPKETGHAVKSAAKKSGQHVKQGAQKFGHIAKKVLY